MVIVPFTLHDDYWEDFTLQEVDIEFLYNHLMELETPLTSQELVSALVIEHIRQAKDDFEFQRISNGSLYMPKNKFLTDQELIFPANNWRKGKVANTRPGENPEFPPFEVISVVFENGEKREFGSGILIHKLNDPPKIDSTDPGLDPARVLDRFAEGLLLILEENLETNPGFVRIAGKWFLRSLLVDINAGHLNLAEAVLDMAGGGPMSTPELIEQIGIQADLNSKLLDFSLDLALQEDHRFDEVGPAGQVLWYLNRLEPPEVLEPPIFLRYSGIAYDHTALTTEMLELERNLDDELSPIKARLVNPNEAEIRLIYPHWRAGTLPLSSRVRHLFPTAYEAPRVLFMLVDGATGQKFAGWVVRDKRYVYGFSEWYKTHNLVPGSIVKIQKGKNPGEVIVYADNRRSTRDWMRTVLVGSDGGVVFAMLKQPVSGPYDDRMVVAIPDRSGMDEVWERMQKDHPPFEKVVINMVRELARLNPQSHVHASELYAVINVIRRCPPGPILAILASRPYFIHVGDMHFRLNEAEIV